MTVSNGSGENASPSESVPASDAAAMEKTTSTAPAPPIAPRSFLPSAVEIVPFRVSKEAVEAVRASFGPEGKIIPERPTRAALAEAGFASDGEAESYLLFRDCMAEVRHPVFIGWQQAPWEDEIDGEDARSVHFNAYETTGGVRAATAAAATETDGIDRIDGNEGVSASASASASALARHSRRGRILGTLRLVPGPFPPHPTPGAQLYPVPGRGIRDPAELDEHVRPTDPAAWAMRRAPGRRDVATAMHDGRELYASLGRMAVLERARGRGVATRLIAAAVEYARQHPGEFDRPVAGKKSQRDGRERGKADVGRGKADVGEGKANVAKGKDELRGDPDTDPNPDDGRGPRDDTGARWRGLFMLHAIRSVAPLYERAGFARDPELGVWFECEMAHVAMWRRIEVERDDDDDDDEDEGEWWRAESG